MWADIGIDLWKVDNCGVVPPGWEKPERRYPPLRDALNATGRPILFSLCVWGVDQPWLWGPEVGNTWRIYEDSDMCDHTPGFDNGCWSHVMKIADAAVGLGRHAGPGGVNDLDILGVANFGMTAAEDASHFFVWVIAKSPLLLGNDVRAMSPETLALLTSPAVLEVSGDALGVGGDLVNRTCSPEPGVEVPCSGGGREPPRSSYPLVYAGFASSYGFVWGVVICLVMLVGARACPVCNGCALGAL
jgi:alpha-galactosidase